MSVKEVPTSVETWLADDLGMVIDGQFSAAISGRVIDSEDPSTGECITSIPLGDASDVNRAVASSRAAFDDGRWRGIKPGKRTEVLMALAGLIRENVDELAYLESWETGKPLRQASGEILLGADAFRYYAGWSTKVLGTTIPSAAGKFAYTLREPIGVCAGITAWNYPFLLAAWKVAPALAFGNSMVLKPSELASTSTLRLAQLCLQAGVPAGVLNVVTGLGQDVGAVLAAHRGIDKIAFTGSTAVGRQIVHASEGNLKRLSLELGGKSANIVFPDADLDSAARASLQGVFTNAGQMCAAGSRILVHADIRDDFAAALARAADGLRIGPGRDPQSEMGPLISAVQRERVRGYIDAGVQGGARRLTTQRELPSDGYFVEPTVFTDVTSDMRIAREEIFGPVASVMTFTDAAEAAAIANDNDYGLAAAVWTRDLNVAHGLVSSLRAGTVWVNTYGVLDSTLPFGGFGESGYGRELGAESVESYTETKSVWMQLG